MEFNLKAESRDFLYSVYDFPGDEYITEELYGECTQGSYISVVATAVGAAEGCGLSIDKETFERWKRVLSAMDYLDDLLDESPDRDLAHRVYSFWIDYLEGDADAPETPAWSNTLLDPSVRLLKNATEPLPVSRKQFLVKAARKIGQLAQEKAACSDTKRYSELLREEGHLTALLLSETVSEPVRQQQGFEKFDNWIKYTTTWANLMLSSKSLKTDKKSGTTGVESGWVNRFKIASYSGKMAVIVAGVKPDRHASLSSVRARLKFGIKRKNKTSTKET